MTAPIINDKVYWNDLSGTVESVEEDGYTVVYRVKHFSDEIIYHHTASLGEVGFESKWKSHGIREVIQGKINIFKFREIY